ncbi:VAC14 [Symbiodinium pilosum]|uniref:VAC14 protein n=1 Tax=Symbiodinium pilosum TaxID=2952 RepID=A0A812LQZ9_SYMPI|nr:VAC14 [Symbiodinium pilosum]
MPRVGHTRVSAIVAPMSPMSDGLGHATQEAAGSSPAQPAVASNNVVPPNGTIAAAVADMPAEMQDVAVPWAQPRLSTQEGSVMRSHRPDLLARAHVVFRAALGLPTVGLAYDTTDVRRLQAEEFGITFGVPTGDANIIKAVKRVVVLSVISSTYYICAFIARLLLGQYTDPGDPDSPDELWSGCSQLIIELSIPACGYYGALYTHRTLLFFFCGANLIFVVASSINFLRYVIRMGGGAEACALEAYATQQRDCELMHSDGPLRYLFLGSLLILTWFSCLSFGAGKGLYQGLAPGDGHPYSSVPVVGEVIATPEGTSSENGSSSSPTRNLNMSEEDRRVAEMAASLASEAAASAR